MEGLVGAAAVVLVLVGPLMWNLGRCWGAILNDARIISRDPALQSKLEILFAYPGESLGLGGHQRGPWRCGLQRGLERGSMSTGKVTWVRVLASMIQASFLGETHRVERTDTAATPRAGA